MRAKRARPVGPAESSVLHDFARSGPTKEAHRRALNQPDGLLPVRSEAGRARAYGAMTNPLGMTARYRCPVSSARNTSDLQLELQERFEPSTFRLRGDRKPESRSRLG
jgi:hypothetical protein